MFDVSSKETSDLKIKIMDSDSGNADDLVGHARQVAYLHFVSRYITKQEEYLCYICYTGQHYI